MHESIEYKKYIEEEGEELLVIEIEAKTKSRGKRKEEVGIDVYMRKGLRIGDVLNLKTLHHHNHIYI